MMREEPAALPLSLDGESEATPGESIKLGEILAYVRDLSLAGDHVLAGEFLDMLKVTAPLARVEGLSAEVWSRVRHHVEHRLEEEAAGTDGDPLLVPRSATMSAMPTSGADMRAEEEMRDDAPKPSPARADVLSRGQGCGAQEGVATAVAVTSLPAHMCQVASAVAEELQGQQSEGDDKAAAEGSPKQSTEASVLCERASKDPQALTRLLALRQTDFDRALAAAFFTVRFQHLPEQAEVEKESCSSGNVEP
eukprot:TRINITY_DN11962_c0_g1_i2.p1 TRINITY_DN11962_c0_g1~~TRINITY_DN11962_c0_g1_i2.p1  ORF type:complete len:251 (-),score=62.62 TRINITY_DN11962_c0_g1_i2:362-1114(-)